MRNSSYGPRQRAHFTAVASDVEVEHVSLSSYTAVVQLPSGKVIAARHRSGEQAPIETDVPSMFLRCAGFDYNILMWTSGPKDDVIRAPYPDVALPVVRPGDMVASADAILLADAPPTGAFSITGPAKLSVRDQASILAELLGRDMRVERSRDVRAGDHGTDRAALGQRPMWKPSPAAAGLRGVGQRERGVRSSGEYAVAKAGLARYHAMVAYDGWPGVAEIPLGAARANSRGMRRHLVPAFEGASSPWQSSSGYSCLRDGRWIWSKSPTLSRSSRP